MALDDRLHGAVGTIPDPAGDAELLGLLAHRLAKPHPLHPPVDKIMPEFHTVLLSNPTNARFAV